MNIQIALPQPVANFIRAVNHADRDAFLSVFTEHALVDDGGREFRGTAAIKEWSEREIFGVNVVLDVRDCLERDGRTVLTVKADGTFDKTGLPDPVLFTQTYTLEKGKISALSTVLAPPPSKAKPETTRW